MTTATQVAASSTTSAAQLASATAATTSTDTTTQDAQDRFLTLLVTQLKNQDPLNPLDNAQITTQLAQLSTVTGINKLNDTLSAMSANADAKQYLQAAALVGHDVVVDGNSLALRNQAATGAFDLGGDADDVSVVIQDASGKAVRTFDVGARTSGVNTFAWDGRDDSGKDLADGTYSIAVTATSGGKAVTVTPLAVTRVSGVVPGAAGGQLQLENLGKVDLASIRQID